MTFKTDDLRPSTFTISWSYTFELVHFRPVFLKVTYFFLPMRVKSNPSWTGLTSSAAHFYHFWTSLVIRFLYFRSKADRYWLMWIKIDRGSCLKWTFNRGFNCTVSITEIERLSYMINEPNWTIKSVRFGFLNWPSSKNRKLMITWLLTVRKNAFDPLSNCSNLIQERFFEQFEVTWSLFRREI